MFKKIMAASAMLAFFACFFACSSDDNSSTTPNSSPSQGGGSSSSQETEAVLISNLGTSGGLSVLFNTYPYGYTLKASSNEDLTPFWSCPPEQSNITPADAVLCRLDQTGAILQNLLTTRDSPLHYIINNMITANPVQRAIKLNSYNLTGAGDQAALGLNVSNDDKSIEEVGISSLNGTAAFTYYYAGGAHKFRVAVNDADYWEADIPAQAEEGLVTINASDLKGMGSFAADETPLNIAKATKFLWVVEFDGRTSGNNTGSLLVYLFSALIEK